MTTIKLTHRPLALMIGLALLSPAPAMAAPTDCEERQSHCEEAGKGRAWLWGGLAALGLGAAAASGGGDNGGGSPGGGNGGGAAPGGQEGGHYGAGTALTLGGTQADWSRGVTTRISGDARNEGTLSLSAGTLHIGNDGELRNTGALVTRVGSTFRIDGEGELENRGSLQVDGALALEGDGGVDNYGRAEFGQAVVTLSGDASIDNYGQMTLSGGGWSLSGDADFDNGRNATLDVTDTRFQLRGRAEFENAGSITLRGSFAEAGWLDVVTSQYGADRDAINALDNRGRIDLRGTGSVLRLSADSHASHAVNRAGAYIQSDAPRTAMLHAEGAHATVLNQGTLTVTGDGAVAMQGARGATLLNDGVINLGTSTENTGRGLVAMKSDGSATLNNRRGGVINIHTADSFAFQMGSAGGGRLINNGIVNVYGPGSGINADAATVAANQPGADLGWQAPRIVSNYTIGTNADGSAGRMVLHEGGYLQDVAVDTGFSRGTDASFVTLTDVITGAEGGAENVRSATITWKAHAHQNADGGIDVTLHRQDYRELAASEQADLAHALEKSYRNNALFHSLEVADQAQFQQALHQLSGAALSTQATQLASNGDALWAALAALPATRTGMLSFGGGSQSAAGVRGDGSAAQLAVALGGGHTLHLASAALKGDMAGGSGQSRGHSRFAGVGLTQQWGNLQLRHQFGYERHDALGQRDLQWGSTRERATSQRQLQRTLLATTLSADVRHGDLHWQPRVKAQGFQLHDSAFSEIGAGDLGLRAAPGRSQGLRMELGSQFGYAANSNLRVRADFALIRSLWLRNDARQGWLHGAQEHGFALPGLRSTGLDYQASFGMDYRGQQFSLATQLLTQRLWGEHDVRAELQLAYRFR